MMMTKLFVSAGAPLHLSGGEIPAPSQVNSTGNLPPSTKSVLVKEKDSIFATVVVFTGGLFTNFRSKIVLSSFKSEDQISWVLSLQVKSKYPSFTPTSSWVKILALLHDVSLNP